MDLCSPSGYSQPADSIQAAEPFQHSLRLPQLEGLGENHMGRKCRGVSGRRFGRNRLAGKWELSL